MKDVIERNEIRDGALLEGILKFIASNIGSIVSTKKISDYLTSSGRKTTSDTIDNYLKMLENAFILYKANRYDLKGIRPLQSISDNYPKYILTMDQTVFNNYSGIKVQNIIDFLLE